MSDLQWSTNASGDATARLSIARRFCGPPASGNGGYCAGLIAQAIDGASEVRLLRPPPLDTPLELLRNADGIRLVHGDRSARGDGPIAHGQHSDLDVAPPPPPPYATALRAQQRYPGFRRHPFPTCFVCGPEREPGDGLRLFSGPLEDGPVYAAPWRPGAAFAAHDDPGKVASGYLWAALDCPSYFALGNPALTALLGQMHSRVDDTPDIDETCVVVAWPIRRSGRKHVAGAAVYGADRRLLGVAVNTWIEVDPERLDNPSY